MEIWHRPPLRPEPVTHIQFFTPNSLWNLLQLAGLQPVSVRLDHHLHPNGSWAHCLRALAPAPAEAEPAEAAPALRSVDVDLYLHPAPATLLSYHFANLPGLAQTLLRRLRRS